MRSPASRISGQYISHVVIVVQSSKLGEPLAHYPNADGTSKGLLYNGKSVRIKTKYKARLGSPNDWPAFVTDYDGGKMDGFNLVVDDTDARVRTDT